VKEHVELPWRASQHAAQEPMSSSQSVPESLSQESIVEQQVGLDVLADSVGNGFSDIEALQEQTLTASDSVIEDDKPLSTVTEAGVSSTPQRTLHWRNFDAALKEITPSSSEALGTLGDLRRWNKEFGEGRKEKKKQVWGKGRFGFTPRSLNATEDGKVQSDNVSSRDVGASQP
jgi:hypothetical protein